MMTRGRQTYFELVYENYSEDFYKNIGKFEDSNLEHDMINNLYNKDIDPKIASKIIERAFKIYKL